MSSYAGLAFPKPGDKKKRTRHMKSIMHQKDGTCYLCGMLHGNWAEHSKLEEHHVFNSYRRKVSEEYGLKVYLCPAHHQNSPEAVHCNTELETMLREEAEKAFLKEHSMKEWMSIIGRNYL